MLKSTFLGTLVLLAGLQLFSSPSKADLASTSSNDHIVLMYSSEPGVYFEIRVVCLKRNAKICTQGQIQLVNQSHGLDTESTEIFDQAAIAKLGSGRENVFRSSAGYLATHELSAVGNLSGSGMDCEMFDLGCFFLFPVKVVADVVTSPVQAATHLVVNTLHRKKSKRLAKIFEQFMTDADGLSSRFYPGKGVPKMKAGNLLQVFKKLSDQIRWANRNS